MLSPKAERRTDQIRQPALRAIGAARARHEIVLESAVLAAQGGGHSLTAEGHRKTIEEGVVAGHDAKPFLVALWQHRRKKRVVARRRNIFELWKDWSMRRRHERRHECRSGTCLVENRPAAEAPLHRLQPRQCLGLREVRVRLRRRTVDLVGNADEGLKSKESRGLDVLSDGRKVLPEERFRDDIGASDYAEHSCQAAERSAVKSARSIGNVQSAGDPDPAAPDKVLASGTLRDLVVLSRAGSI